MKERLTNETFSREEFDSAQQALVTEFTKYRESLWHAVYSRLDHRIARRVDPDDVLQEAWIDANNRLPQFMQQRESWSMNVWIRVILKQTLINVHRRHLCCQKRDASREFCPSQFGCENSESVSTLAEICTGGSILPCRSATDRETQFELAQVLKRLKPQDQIILKLRHFEELCNKATAAKLGLSEKAASMRYARAIERLKKEMRNEPAFA